MCGLALVLSKKKKHTGQRIYDVYKAQSGRGQQGYGFISIRNGEIHQVFRSLGEHAFKQALMKDNSEIILAHHRFPTSTKNVLGATHPIFVSHPELDFDYYIAHNGVITNSYVLKRQHEELGYKYNTAFTEHTVAKFDDGREEIMDSERTVFNDSESLAVELARFIEGKSDKVNTNGAAAFIGIAVEKGGKKVDSLFFGKNRGRDLCISENNKWYIISSETGSDLEDMKLWKYSLSGKDWEERDLPIDIAEPVKTNVGYHRNWHTETSPRVAVESRTLADSIMAQDGLVNALYTLSEAMDSGVPIGEFFTFNRGGIVYYVPFVYSSYDIERPLLAHLKQQQLTLPPSKQDIIKYTDEMQELDPKVRDLLDGYVEEYVNLKNTIEVTEDSIDQGFWTREEWQEYIDQGKLRLQEIEENISALAIDDDIIDEMTDMYQELLDSSGNVPSPYALLEI